jgi:hypothetical protein
MPEFMDKEPEPQTRVPNLMKVGEIPVDMEVDNDTSVLDPVVNTNTFCRFVLDNKGFLHSNSKITLGVDKTGEQTFPANIGVHSLIERCALKIGTHTISETDDFNHLMAYKSMFIPQDRNLERETYLNSRIMNHEFLYINDNTGDDAGTSASHVSIGTYLNYEINTAGDAGDLESQPEIRTGNKPVFQVSLADLFPMLQDVSFPLYMCDEQISIEIHFTSDTTNRRCVFDTNESPNASYPIDITQTKLIADYIYYPNDEMEAYARQNPKIEYTFKDYRLNKRTFTQAQLLTEQNFDIGGAGRVCSKIISGVEHVTANGDTELSVGYKSVAPAVANLNNGRFITNCLYNDQRLYPIDRSNGAVHFNDVSRAEGVPPHVLRQEYNKEGVMLPQDFTYMGREPSSSTQGFNGFAHWIVYALNRNERINSNGIRLQTRYTKCLAGSFIHRSYLELIKTATLENGRFRTQYA